LLLLCVAVAFSSPLSIEVHERKLSTFFSVKCASCEHVLSNLPEHPLRSNIEAAVAELCSETHTPGCFEKMSHSLDYLQRDLEKKSASEVCHEIGWCRRGHPFQLPQSDLAVNHTAEQVQGSISCTHCTKAFPAVQARLEEGNLPRRLKAGEILEMLCKQMPEKYLESCMSVNTTELSKVLSQDSVSVCKRMGMCKVPRHAPKQYFRVATTPSNAGPKCQACQWAISAMEAYFAQDTTTDELSRILQELCTVLPGDYAETCQNFVLVYTPQALGWMIDNLTPPVVCEQISFCTYDHQ